MTQDIHDNGDDNGQAVLLPDYRRLHHIARQAKICCDLGDLVEAQTENTAIMGPGAPGYRIALDALASALTALKDLIEKPSEGPALPLTPARKHAYDCGVLLDESPIQPRHAVVSMLAIAYQRAVKVWGHETTADLLRGLDKGLDPVNLLEQRNLLVERDLQRIGGRQPWVRDVELDPDAGWETDSGCPGYMVVGNLIQGYVTAHSMPMTTAEVATGLNLSEGVVFICCAEHPHLALEDGTVQLEED